MKTTSFYVWAPVALLWGGFALLGSVNGQRKLLLRESLTTALPEVMNGFRGSDVTIAPEERKVAGMSDYVFRVYSPSGSQQDLERSAFSVYVGYYRSQTQGKTIHSPKNCLPGAGWEALTTARLPIRTPNGPVLVNEYLLQNGSARAMVLYWYQGRGRIEANEYRVKWDLLRDQMIRRRSDEALVRIVVPVVGGDQDQALRTATRVAEDIVPDITRALPAG